jgi:hypothetical protein
MGCKVALREAAALRYALGAFSRMGDLGLKTPKENLRIREIVRRISSAGIAPVMAGTRTEIALSHWRPQAEEPHTRTPPPPDIGNADGLNRRPRHEFHLKDRDTQALLSKHESAVTYPLIVEATGQETYVRESS